MAKSGIGLNNAPSQNLIQNQMAQTKIGFDKDEFDQKYKGKETEKVWVDFGKVNTNVLRYDPEIKQTMDFNGHRMYYMMPPSSKLQPSNVLMFEIVYLSSKNTCKDVILGWGAFPIVNGEFEINTGKFKVPIMFDKIDFQTNKFKDIEQKYMRNIDEWLCNLYIQVRKIELFDFRYHEEKIEFTVPKKYLKEFEKQKKREIELKLSDAHGSADGGAGSTRDSSREISIEDDDDDEESEYSSSDEENSDGDFDELDQNIAA